jgi:hypothetical protein
MYGKVVYADKGMYRHYGIGVGNGYIIHFDKSTGKITKSSLAKFSDGCEINICYRTIIFHYPPEKIVERAYIKLGSSFDGYDLINNNCEHFANWCAMGKRTSIQVFFKNDDQDVVEKAIDRICGEGYKFGCYLDDTPKRWEILRIEVLGEWLELKGNISNLIYELFDSS